MSGNASKSGWYESKNIAYRMANYGQQNVEKGTQTIAPFGSTVTNKRLPFLLHIVDPYIQYMYYPKKGQRGQ